MATDMSDTAISLEEQLRQASILGDLNSVMRLVQSEGIYVDTLFQDGWTPLMYAAHRGHISVAEFLLNAGATVNNLNNTLGSSLHCACYKLNIGMAELLLERGADTNLTNQSGKLPFDYLDERNKSALQLVADAYRVGKHDTASY